MSDWDKIAAYAAIEYAKPTMRPVQTMSDHMADAFHDGARWMREALLSDEAVELAARALYAEDVNESMDTPWPDYDSPKNVGRPLYEERARNALLAAIEGEQ